MYTIDVNQLLDKHTHESLDYDLLFVVQCLIDGCNMEFKERKTSRYIRYEKHKNILIFSNKMTRTILDFIIFTHTHTQMCENNTFIK